jgi:hypothetical protein
MLSERVEIPASRIYREHLFIKDPLVALQTRCGFRRLWNPPMEFFFF